MTTIDPTEKADDAAPAAPTYERTTSTRGTRIIGGATIVAMAWLVDL